MLSSTLSVFKTNIKMLIVLTFDTRFSNSAPVKPAVLAARFSKISGDASRVLLVLICVKDKYIRNYINYEVHINSGDCQFIFIT